MLSFSVTFVSHVETSENEVSLTFLDYRRYLFLWKLLNASLPKSMCIFQVKAFIIL